MTEDLRSAQSPFNIKRSVDLIIVTAQILLYQIETNLDRALLDNNTLQLNFQPVTLFETVTQICHIYRVHSNDPDVGIVLQQTLSEISASIDKVRTQSILINVIKCNQVQ